MALHLRNPAQRATAFPACREATAFVFASIPRRRSCAAAASVIERTSAHSCLFG